MPTRQAGASSRSPITHFDQAISPSTRLVASKDVNKRSSTERDPPMAGSRDFPPLAGLIPPGAGRTPDQFFEGFPTFPGLDL